jgi:hypothetical protein
MADSKNAIGFKKLNLNSFSFRGLGDPFCGFDVFAVVPPSSPPLELLIALGERRLRFIERIGDAPVWGRCSRSL